MAKQNEEHAAKRRKPADSPSVTTGEKPDERKAVKIGWALYQQVAAVLGALALAALLGHFFDIGWRGFLATLVGYWGEYMRPVARWAFALIVSAPLRWAFGWHFEVPLLARDYVATGAILSLSIFRVKDWPRIATWASKWGIISAVF